jgi:hypothetical protein
MPMQKSALWQPSKKSWRVSISVLTSPYFWQIWCDGALGVERGTLVCRAQCCLAAPFDDWGILFDIIQYLDSAIEKFFEPQVSWLALQV